ncbi:ABC transporter permease [Microbacterium karelineae]|uniref:ABC transporter permease n=1 Tax=Microbacterium karelineae TaxID=2654283 RepID=UPI0012EACD9D|nr:ABC transporter permease [Microbacterium karelineae]
MTATASGPRVARTTWPDPVPLEAPERHVLAPWRIALKMAVRQSLRSWPSSLLIVLLIFLPMAGVAGAVTLATSIGPTPQQRVDAELGNADAWVQAVSMGEGMRQQLDEPTSSYSTGPASDEGIPPADDVRAHIDADRLIEIAHGDAVVETDDGIASLPVTIGDAWDPLLDGRYTLLEGRAPASDDEILVSPRALERLGARIGDTLVATDPEASPTIVGTMSSSLEPDAAAVVFAPESGPFAADENIGWTTWYAEGWHATADEVYALNGEGIVVFDRALVLDPGDGARGAFDSMSGTAWALFSAALAALAFSVYLVALLAGAAFSVSAKRQQRSLAVAASVGADRRDVFRIVLFQGTILGLAGGVVGSAAGVGLGGAALAILDTGETLQYSWGLRIPWLALLALAAIAGIVGTLSALAPARRATTGDTLAALRGARRPVRVSAARPQAGALLIVLGITIVAVSVIVLVATYNSPLHGTPRADPIYLVFTLCMIVGPLLLQIGVVIAGHWLLALASRALSRLGLGARLAVRDAVANPGRSVPSFGAIAACAFLATAAFGGVATINAMRVDAFQGTDPVGSAVVQVGADTASAGGDPRDALAVTEAAAERATEILVEHGAAATAVLAGVSGPVIDPETGDVLDGDTQTVTWPEVQTPEWCAGDDDCEPSAWETTGMSAEPIVVAPDDLETALGAAVPASTREAFARGSVVVTDPQWLTDDGRIVFNEWRANDVYGPDPSDDEVPDAVSSRAVDAVLVDSPWQFTSWSQAYLSPEGADVLGVDHAPRRVIGAYDGGPTTAQLDGLIATADELTAAHSGDEVPTYFSAYEAVRPPEAAGWLWLILGAVSVLVVAASAVALGLSRIERRPDDATLAAVGAQPGVRRSVSAWQALVIAGFGCAAGTLAGLMPVLGLVGILAGTTGDGLTVDAAPWGFWAILAFALPLAIALVSWLVPLRRPDLTRRTAIA